MTTQERFNEITENILQLSNNLKQCRVCVYYDPYYDNKKTYFGARAKSQAEVDAEVMKYAEEHPVEQPVVYTTKEP